MKLAITGKGGVGKTTIAALLSGALAGRRRVTAIDCDPDSNLAACIGCPNPHEIKPLVELKEMIEERTGVKPGAQGAMFSLNPKVDDIPERYGIQAGGIRVLTAGAVKKGGAGCYCPENALVRALVAHLLLDEGTALVLDMEAGVEHLSRGTLSAVDKMLVVVGPGRRSVETAFRIKTMASQIGLERLSAVGNKIRSDADKQFLKTFLRDIPFSGFVPYDEALREAETGGKPAFGASDIVNEAIFEIVKNLETT